MSLLHLPHHDGSPVYVFDEAPALGDTVTVRVRTSPDDPVDTIWLRTTYDAEPVFHEMSVVRSERDAVWWEGLLAAQHVLGTEDCGGDLIAGTDGIVVPDADGPRLDVWALATE